MEESSQRDVGSLAPQDLAPATEGAVSWSTKSEEFLCVFVCLCHMLLSSAWGWDTLSLGTVGHSLVAGLTDPESSEVRE